MSEWKKYRRVGLSEMRPYVPGESLEHISVSETDDPPSDLGMIARNPKNHDDQWYVARKYFEDNLELVPEGKTIQREPLDLSEALSENAT